MKNWKKALVSLSLSLIVFGGAISRADEPVKPTAGQVCLQGFYRSRDAVAKKYGADRDHLLTDKQASEITPPAGCTLMMVMAEMQKQSDEAIKVAIGDDRPLGVSEKLWSGSEGPAFSDTDTKVVAPQAIGPAGGETLLHALGLGAGGLPPTYRAN